MSVDNAKIVEGLRYAESIRNLDPNTAMKIALALAGVNPELFSKLLEITKTQNIIAPSTLELKPVPIKPENTR